MITFTVTLQPEGEGPDAVVRLRHLLKFALRSCGLRAVAVTDSGSAVTTTEGRGMEQDTHTIEDDHETA